MQKCVFYRMYQFKSWFLFLSPPPPPPPPWGVNLLIVIYLLVEAICSFISVEDLYKQRVSE